MTAELAAIEFEETRVPFGGNPTGGYARVAEMTAPDGVRYRAIVEPFYDGNTADLRSETPAEIVTWRYDRHGIGDRSPTAEEMTAYEHGGWAGLVRHLTRNGALVVLPVSGISHSGESIWVASAPNETAMGDSAGWDSGQWGFVTVSRDRWRDDYKRCITDGHPSGHAVGDSSLVGKCVYGRTAESDARADRDAAEMIEYTGTMRGPLWGNKVSMMLPRAECAARYAVAELDDLLTGNVWAYRIERLETWRRIAPEDLFGDREEWETVDAVCGFVGDPEYCESEARSALQSAVKAGNTAEAE